MRRIMPSQSETLQQDWPFQAVPIRTHPIDWPCPTTPDDKPIPVRPFQSTCLALSSPADRQPGPYHSRRRPEPSRTGRRTLRSTSHAPPTPATCRPRPHHHDYPGLPNPIDSPIRDVPNRAVPTSRAEPCRPTCLAVLFRAKRLSIPIHSTCRPSPRPYRAVETAPPTPALPTALPKLVRTARLAIPSRPTHLSKPFRPTIPSAPSVRHACPTLALPSDRPLQATRSRRLSAPFHTGRPAHPSPATFQSIPHRRAALHPAAPSYVVPGDFPSRPIPTPCTPPRSRWSGRVEG